MAYTLLQNKDGKFVAADADDFKAAAANADWAKSYYQVLTDQPGKDAWPITGATFILMYKEPDKPRRAARRSSSSTGPTPTATRWPTTSTTCRCRTRSRRSSQGLGPSIKDASGKADRLQVAGRPIVARASNRGRKTSAATTSPRLPTHDA